MHPRQHFRVDQGQTVLVGRPARPAADQFRSGVATVEQRRRLARRQPHQRDHAEVGDPQLLAVDQQVARVQPQVLQTMTGVQRVQRFRRRAQQLQQIGSGQTGLSLRPALIEPVAQRLLERVRQDDQSLRRAPVNLRARQDGVAQRLQMGNQPGVVAHEVQHAQGAARPAVGVLGPPEVAERPLMQARDEAIPGQHHRGRGRRPGRERPARRR